MSEYFVGIDIGTTNLKALVTDSKGNMLHRHTLPCPTLHPKNTYAEQNPTFIFQQLI